MSTNCVIGLEKENGEVILKNVKYGGYIEDVGVTLFEMYNNRSDVEELFNHSYSYNSIRDKQLLGYECIKPRKFINIEKNNIRESWNWNPECIFIYRTNNEWVAKELNYNKDKNEYKWDDKFTSLKSKIEESTKYGIRRKQNKYTYQFKNLKFDANKITINGNEYTVYNTTFDANYHVEMIVECFNHLLSEGKVTEEHRNLIDRYISIVLKSANELRNQQFISGFNDVCDIITEDIINSNGHFELVKVWDMKVYDLKMLECDIGFELNSNRDISIIMSDDKMIQSIY